MMSEKILRIPILKALLVLYTTALLVRADPPKFSVDYTDVPYTSQIKMSSVEDGEKSYLYVAALTFGKDSNKLSLKVEDGSKEVNKNLTFTIDGDFVDLYKLTYTKKDSAKSVLEKIKAAKDGEDDPTKQLKDAITAAGDVTKDSKALKVGFVQIKDQVQADTIEFTSKDEEKTEVGIKLSKEFLKVKVNVKDGDKGKDTAIVAFDAIDSSGKSLAEVEIKNKDITEKIFTTLGLTVPGKSSPWYTHPIFIIGMIILILAVIIIIIVVITNSNNK